MRPKFRSIILTSLCATALAGPAAAVQAQPESNTVVGPGEIRDFNLPGTQPPPEREPEATPAPTPPPVAEPVPEPAPPVATPAEPAPTPAPETQAAPESTTPPAERSRDADRQDTAEPGDNAPRESVSEAEASPVAPPVAAAPEATPAAPAETAPVVSDPAAEEGSNSLLWLLGALALLGGAFAAWNWRRRQASEEEALAATEPLPDLTPLPEPPPLPDPEPIPPVAAVAAAAPAVTDPAPANDIPAIVMRPWLELHFKPARATATDGGASVQYDAVIRNVGNAPARNVRLAARMFNSGPEVQAEVGHFYAMGIDAPDGAPLTILPRTEVSLSSVVTMAREDMREVKVQGRSLFIPTIAFNLLYDWGRDKIGQTCSAHVVGREPDPPAEKMAPFRLDLGPRVYRSVGQRPSALARAV